MAATETAAAERPNYDPVALAESLASAADKSAKVLGDFMTRQAAGGKSMVTDEFGLTQAFLELAAKMLSNPLAVPSVGFPSPLAHAKLAR